MKHPVWSTVITFVVICFFVGIIVGDNSVSPASQSTKLSTAKNVGNSTQLKTGVNSLLQMCGSICLKTSWNNEDITMVVSDQWYAEPNYEQERWVTVMAQAWMTLQKESGFSTDTSTFYVEDSYGKRLAKYSSVFGFSRYK